MSDRNQPKHAVNILTAPEQMLQAVDKYYFFAVTKHRVHSPLLELNI